MLLKYSNSVGAFEACHELDAFQTIEVGVGPFEACHGLDANKNVCVLFVLNRAKTSTLFKPKIIMI